MSRIVLARKRFMRRSPMDRAARLLMAVLAPGALTGVLVSSASSARSATVMPPVARFAAHRNYANVLSYVAKKYDRGVAIDAGDVNADGRVDLTASWFIDKGAPRRCELTRGGNVLTLRNDGSGGFAVGALRSTPTYSADVATAADLDGDRRADLVTANYCTPTVSVFPTRSTARTYAVGGTRGRAVVTGDLDGSGGHDVVAAFGTGIDARLNDGSGAFPAAIRISNSPTVDVAIADVDADGHADVVGLAGGQFAVYRGNGDGTFGRVRTVATGLSRYGASALATADLNGDGAVDLVTADGASEPNVANVAVLINDGRGSFGDSRRYVAGKGARAIAVADFNRDGHADIATANGQTPDLGGITIIYGAGDGMFAGRSAFDVGYHPTDIVAADFNADGRIDLAASLDKRYGAKSDAPLVGVIVNATPRPPAQP